MRYVYRGEPGPFEPGVTYDLARQPAGDCWEPVTQETPAAPAEETPEETP